MMSSGKASLNDKMSTDATKEYSQPLIEWLKKQRAPRTDTRLDKPQARSH